MKLHIKENTDNKEHIYRVWYNPYNLGPEEEDYVDITTDTEEHARRLGNDYGYVTEIELIECNKVKNESIIVGGSEYSNYEMEDAVAYMYGVSPWVASDMIRNELSDNDIKRAIIYYDLRDLPVKIRQQEFEARCKKWNVVKESLDCIDTTKRLTRIKDTLSKLLDEEFYHMYQVYTFFTGNVYKFRLQINDRNGYLYKCYIELDDNDNNYVLNSNQSFSSIDDLCNQIYIEAKPYLDEDADTAYEKEQKFNRRVYGKDY